MALPAARRVSLEPGTPPCLMLPVSDTSLSFDRSEVKASVPHPPATTTLSSSPSPNSSLYLAVKVRSLVNTFRKRAKRHAHTGRGRRADDTSFCRDVEREAYREIDRYLGRKPKHNRGWKCREGAKKGIASGSEVGSCAILSCDSINVERCVMLNAGGHSKLTAPTIANWTIGH